MRKLHIAVSENIKKWQRLLNNLETEVSLSSRSSSSISSNTHVYLASSSSGAEPPQDSPSSLSSYVFDAELSPPPATSVLVVPSGGASQLPSPRGQLSSLPLQYTSMFLGSTGAVDFDDINKHAPTLPAKQITPSNPTNIPSSYPY